MPDVIINFKPVITGESEVLAALGTLGDSEKQLATDIAKANKEFSEQGKTVDKDTASIKKLNDAFKGLPKVIIGGANKELEELKKKVDAGNVSVNVLASTLKLAKQRLQEMQQGTAAFTTLQKEIKAAEIAGNTLNKTFTSMRGELRATREALSAMEEAGLEGTKVFNDLAVSAGKLDDQIGDTQARIKALGSDTLALDAGIQAIQGVAGAFSVLQGAAALAGDENEDLQKALLKVNAAMSILNGLQQLQTILQKQSILSIVTENALRKIGALSTNLQAAAESRFTIIRVAATQAQVALNAAMAANPGTVLLVALGLLAGALLLFTNRSDDGADAQSKLADEAARTNESFKNQAEFIDVLNRGYQQEINLLRARGATGEQILNKEIEVLNKRIDNNRRIINEGALLSGAEEAYSKAVEENSELRGEILVKEAEREKVIRDTSKEERKKAREQEIKDAEKFLRDLVAANEIAVLEAKDGFEKLAAQIFLIEAKLRLALSQPGLGANERVLAELQAGEEIRKIREQTFGQLETLGQREKSLRDKDFLARQQEAQRQLQLKQQTANKEVEITEQQLEKEKNQRKALIKLYLDAAGSLAGSLVEISRNQNAQELEALDDRLKKGLISQNAYDAQVRAAKRRQAVQDKQLALFQAFINTASAIVEALPNIPLSVIAGVLGAAQIAAIASRPIPAFAKGTKNAPKGYGLVGEAGPELIQKNGKVRYVNKPSIVNFAGGETVVPANITKNIMDAYKIPVPNVAAPNINTSYSKNFSIDYNKLGRVMSEQMGRIPLQVFNMDENGFTSYQQSITQRNNYLNNNKFNRG